jgi:hypothetical protein
MEEILKMLVHHIDHSIAERPKKKEGADETKDPQMAPSICPFEKSSLIRSVGSGVFSVHIGLA